MIAKRLTTLLFVTMLALSVAAPGAFAKHPPNGGHHKPPPPPHHMMAIR